MVHYASGVAFKVYILSSHTCSGNRTNKQIIGAVHPQMYFSSTHLLVYHRTGEDRSLAAEFRNPAPTHKPCRFQISLKDLISWVRCV